MYSLLHRHLKVCDGRSALLHSAPQRFGILAGERNMSNLDVIKEPSFVEPRRYNVSGSSGCRSGTLTSKDGLVCPLARLLHKT